MKSKASAYAGIVQAVVFALILLFTFVIEPSQGLAGPKDFANVAKMEAYARNVPGLYFLDWFLNIIFAATILILAMVLYERLYGNSPLWTRVAASTGVISVGFLVACGVMGLMSPAEVPIGFEFELIGVFAYGWWVLLISWVAMKGGFPNALTYLGVVWGLLGIVPLLLVGLVPAVAIIFPLSPALGVIWAGWLGFTLLNEK